MGEHRHEGSEGTGRTLYVEALAAPDTIDTMPEKTLLAFAAQGPIKSVMPTDGGDAEKPYWRALAPPVSTRRARRASCRWKARNPSSSHGPNSCKASPRKARRWPHRESPNQSARRTACAGGDRW
jgi:hypothetical protein